MDSEENRTLSDTEVFEIISQGIESANKLHILYLYGKEICFTDSFKETIKIINENDLAWKAYIEILDGMSDMGLAKDPSLNEHLMYMVTALIDIHLTRLEIMCTKDDYTETFGFISSIYKKQCYRAIEKGTRDRQYWLPLMGIGIWV